MELSDDEGLDFIEEKLITNRSNNETLSNIERALLTNAWRNPRRTYQEIAEAEGYSQSYVHNVASELWNELSSVFHTKIRKPNLKATICSIMLRDRQASATALDQPGRHDFGNWMGAIELLGREPEQQQLAEHLVADQARIIGVMGITKIGKSCLCEAVVRRLAHQFPVILCRSVRSQISLADILNRLITLLDPENYLGTATLEDLLPAVIQLMQQQRCLLILEDFDAIAQTGSIAQQEAALYQQFLQRTSQLATGCVLVISRINTEILNLPVWQQGHHLSLSSLNPLASQQLMAQYGALPPAPLLDDIQTYYAHHPHYLSVVAQQVHGTLSGSWPYFWDSLSTRIVQSVQHCLESDYSHLNSVEQAVIHWLAVAAKPLSINHLQLHLSCIAPQRAPQLVPQPAPQLDLIHTVAKLRDRGFIQAINPTQTGADNGAKPVPSYVLTRIWRDFIIQRLRDAVVEELQTGHFHLLHHLPIRSVLDPVPVTQQQADQLVQPILQRLQERYGSTNLLKSRLKALLEQVCTRQLDARSHTAGNLINFCQTAGVSFDGLDFSDLDICHADFRQASLWNCTGHHTRLRDCGFMVPLAAGVTLALDATGQHLAVGESSGHITIWQTETATPMQSFHDAEICSLAFHPQQPILAYGTAVGFVCLRHWQGQADSTVIIRKVHNAPIGALSFSADGETLAIGDRTGRVALWHRPLQANSTLQELPTLAERQSTQLTTVRHLIWSDDSQQLAISDGYTGLLWNRQTVTIKPFGNPNIGRIQSLMFEENKLYAAISDRTSLRLWSLEPDWLLATAEEEATIISAHLWKTKTTQPVIYLAYSKDDQLILKIVNPNLDEIARITVGLNTPLAISSDGQRFVAMPAAHCIQLWQMPSDVPSDVPSDSAPQAAVPPASPAISIPATPPIPSTPLANPSAVSTASPSVIQRWLGYSCPVQTYAFSPTGKLLAVGNRDGSLRVWDLDTVRCRHVFQAAHTRMCVIALSPDSQHLASSDSSGHLWLWNLASDQLPVCLEGYRHEMTTLAFHPSQPQLASGSTSGTIRLWHTVRGTMQHTLQHRVGITHLIFSSDGQYLISGDRQGYICVWDLNHHQLMTGFQAHGSAIEYLGLTPSGHLVSAGRDHKVCRWDQSYQAATVLFENVDFYISHLDCTDDPCCWIIGWHLSSNSSKNNPNRQAQIILVDSAPSHSQQSTTTVINLPFLQHEEQLFFTPNHGMASLQLGDRFQLWERVEPQLSPIHSSPDIDILLNSPYQGFRLRQPEGLSPVQIEQLKRLGALIDK